MNFRKFGSIIRANKSIILSLLGISGMLYGTAHTGVVCWEAGQEHRKVHPKELIIPAIIDLLSAGCIIKGNLIDRKEKNALMAGYILYSSVREKMRGNNTEKVDSMARKAAEDLHLGKNLDEYHYFYDPISKHVFYTDMKTVVGAEYLINRQLSIYGTVDVQDWFWLLGIEVTDDKAINLIDHGWDYRVLEEYFDDPGIIFNHPVYGQDYITVLPDGSAQCIPGKDILEITMSYYPKELCPVD